MLAAILKNKRLRFGARCKRFAVYARERQLIYRDWKWRFGKIFHQHPKYLSPCSRLIEREHSQIWRPFRHRLNKNTIRVCNSISGVADPWIVPEEIFVTDLQPSLNRFPIVDYISNKSFYNRWFGKGDFPVVYLHSIDGELLDENMKSISSSDAEKTFANLPYPVVFKPNMGSSGGEDVFFPCSAGELAELMRNRKNYVVQEKIKQHEFFDKFNPVGLNTVRACLYRSVKDNQIHILNLALRMGKGGSLDNETAGGIVCFIREDGYLNELAVDKYGGKYHHHPDTGLTFNEAVPNIPQLRELAKTVAHDIFLARLISLDLCYDENGRWRLIEVNLNGQTIRFAQYAGMPFFGPFSQEVVEHCSEHHWALS